MCCSNITTDGVHDMRIGLLRINMETCMRRISWRKTVSQIDASPTPVHSAAGAALIPSTIVGEAVGREQRPLPAAIVGSSYGLEPKTMTIHREDLTPTEATPSSVSDHRLARSQTEITSPTPSPPTTDTIALLSEQQRVSSAPVTSTHVRTTAQPSYKRARHACDGLEEFSGGQSHH